jgi:hypothetical protein
MDWRWSVVLAAALLALMVWSLPRAIQGGDAGEFATIMLTGGVPHPSGYPWMRILGLLARASWALGLPPALAAALPPALCGVGAWLVAHRSCAAIGHTRLGAWLVAVVAASPLVVLHVNDSEVWGPHLLFSALFIHTVVSTRRPTPQRPLALGLLLGLAVSHHLTAILLVPLAVAAAAPGREPEQSVGRWSLALLRNGALGLAGSSLGLLAFSTLAIGRGGGWRWGDVRSLRGLVHHITRADYGTFSLSLHDEPVAASATIGRALASVAEVFSAGLVTAPSFGALILVGSIAGLAVMVGPFSRRVAIGWGLSIGASALAFPAAQNIDPASPFGAWILERFDLLTVLLLIVPIAAGLGWLGERLAARLEVRPAVLRVGAWSIAAVLLLAQIGATLERGRPATEAAVELAAVDMLETPDPRGPPIATAGGPIRAIVFGTDDHRSFPGLYAQEVLGAGAHTLYIDAQLLAHPWYRARLRARLPGLPDVDKPLRMIGEIWSDPTLSSAPIYLANVFSAPAERLHKVPEGLLWRIPAPSDHPSFDARDWTPEAIAERHLAAFARYRVRPEDFAGLEHPRGHPWSTDLWHAYVDKSRLLAATLARAGRADLAEEILAALAATTGAGR